MSSTESMTSWLERFRSGTASQRTQRRSKSTSGMRRIVRMHSTRPIWNSAEKRVNADGDKGSCLRLPFFAGADRIQKLSPLYNGGPNFQLGVERPRFLSFPWLGLVEAND